MYDNIFDASIDENFDFQEELDELSRTQIDQIAFLVWANSKTAGRVRALLGFCGFRGWDRPHANQARLLAEDCPAMGWRLRRDAWGQGIASEAAAVALRHGYEACGFARVVATVQPDNIASAAVARKLGMELWESESHDKLCVFQLDRATWVERQNIRRRGPRTRL